MSGTRGAGPSPDGRHDDLTPEDLDGLSLTVPDDPRDLDADRAAWLHGDSTGDSTGDPTGDPALDRTGDPALDRTGDRPTWRQGRQARRRRLAITAGVVAVSMLVVAASGAVGAWIVGPQASAPAAVPLASAVPDPGQIGGLLPEDALLRGASTTVSARSIRPAVIVLVPPSCNDCATLLTGLAAQVGSFGYALVAVGSPDQTDQLSNLTEAVGATKIAALTDLQNTLRTTYGLTGTTLLLVRDDGVVVDVVRDPTPGTHIEGALVNLAPAAGLDT